jgi:hypothetical protein
MAAAPGIDCARSYDDPKPTNAPAKASIAPLFSWKRGGSIVGVQGAF